MNRVGNPFRFSFIIPVVFGIRLEADDLLVSNADPGHAPGAYQSNVSKDIGGASVVQYYDGRIDVFDYYDDEDWSAYSFNQWTSMNFSISQSFSFNACGSSALASMGSDVSSSSEMGSDVNSSTDWFFGSGGTATGDVGTSTITATVSAGCPACRIRVNQTGSFWHGYNHSLETNGIATLNLSVTFTHTGEWQYNRSFSIPAAVSGALNLYVEVFVKFTLTMEGSITLSALFPVEWNVCVTGWLHSCSGITNSVSAHSPTFTRELSATATGTAEVTPSLKFEAGSLLSATAAIINTMTVSGGTGGVTCQLHSEYSITVAALAALVNAFNAVAGAVGGVLGHCFSQLADLALGALLTGVLYDAPCR